MLMRGEREVGNIHHHQVQGGEKWQQRKYSERKDHSKRERKGRLTLIRKTDNTAASFLLY